MYIVSNEKMIKTRAQWSSYLMIGGFALIGVSFFLTFFNPNQSAYVLPAYLALFAGFIVFNVGASYGSQVANASPPRPGAGVGAQGHG